MTMFDSCCGKPNCSKVGMSVVIVRSTPPTRPCWTKALTRKRPMPGGEIAKLHSLVASKSLICRSFINERMISAEASAGSAALRPHQHPLRLRRSEEHTSELQSLMRISYAVFCLKKKKYSQLSISTKHV